MLKVGLYSVLLILGMGTAYFADLKPYLWLITSLTMICLAYVMIEVGVEFTLDKRRMRSYGKDYLVAATAALFPWIFCSVYFFFVFDVPALEALIVGRFAAPTSAGVLFTMLAAAGLGATWLFKKARVLAIFDDIDTILIMIPLQFAFLGLDWRLLVLIPLIVFLLFAAYQWLHKLKWPTGPFMLLVYAIVWVVLLGALEKTTHVELEIILPAFVWGCILFNPHGPATPDDPSPFVHDANRIERLLDNIIKALFMFLVGASLPPMQLGKWSIGILILHVVLLTLLSNIGKTFPTLCYRKEATMRERVALSVALYPRGEVGAGVLLLALNYGIRDEAISMAVASLALNLILTGLFIWIVLRLVRIPSRS